MNTGRTVIVYQDKDTLTNIDDFTTTKLGNSDADDLLEPGELFKIDVSITGDGLTDDDQFSLQVKPPDGAVLIIDRRVPDRIETRILVD